MLRCLFARPFANGLALAIGRMGPGRPGHRRTVTPSLGRRRRTRLPLTRRPPCGTARAYTPSCRGRFGGCSTPRGLPGTTRPSFALPASSECHFRLMLLLSMLPGKVRFRCVPAIGTFSTK